MIVGVFLKNYKVYDGIKFIPVTYDEYFSAYFGQNGVGKSSILEALDTFFNGRPWNDFKSGKGGNGYVNIPYIVPVFLIKKDEVQISLKKWIPIIEKLSNYYWNVKSIDNSVEGNTFIEFRNRLNDKVNKDDFYLLALGIREDEPRNIFFGTFQRQNNFFEHLGLERSDKKNQNEKYKDEDEIIAEHFSNGYELLTDIKDLYHYIYIPSDVEIASYTQLETQNMQKLMHKDVKKEIQKAISQEKLDAINASLKNFVDNISDKLTDYTYEKPMAGKSNITMPDLVNKIIKAYFSIRVLTKTTPVKVPVNNLSSGEKRKALIDLAYAFLDDNEEHDRKIILAIDEPEISLHISACYEQFEKLKIISSHNHQVIITTHWYGFLPVLGLGIAHNIVNYGNEKLITSYSLYKYQEEINLSKIQHEPPYDVYLKGIYDLVQSIVASLRADKPYKYILVEGSSDKIYLEHYLKYFVLNDNLRIMPLGGCGEVLNVMEHLYMAMSKTRDKYTGKVLAIVDTDNRILQPKFYEDIESLKFRRILFDSSEKNIILENISSLRGNPITTIEDILEPEIFKAVLKEICKEKEQSFSFFDREIKNSKCSYSTFDLTETERENLRNFFNETGVKTEFSKRYVEKKTDLTKFSIGLEICNLLKLDINKVDITKEGKISTKKVKKYVKKIKKSDDLPTITTKSDSNLLIEEVFD